MFIREIETENKRDYLPLLLLADEQESMINLYLDRGTMFVLEENGQPIGECVVTDEGGGAIEIQNLAIEPAFQRQGYGKKLVSFVVERYRDEFETLQIGTGDSPLTVPFYESCGLTVHHVIPNYFLEHYDHPIFEGGKQLKDKVYLQMDLKVTKGKCLNVLTIQTRREFREWLSSHPDESECWVAVKRGKPVNPETFYYLDAVEEALCFGWIDSTHKEIGGVRMQRFGPRKKNSPWTELNKERVRRLEKLGLMTDRGRAVLPPIGPRSFKIDPDIETALKKARAWSKFRSFPPLYQRIRAYNVAFYKKRNPAMYEQTLKHLIEETKQGRMFGEWNDYERLLDY